MKTKRYLATLLTLTMLGSLIFGIRPYRALAKEQEDINSKMYFSLEDSIETALKHNTNLKLEAEEYEMAKVERSQAKYTSDKIQKIRDDRILKHFVPQVFTFEGGQAKDLAPRLKEAEELIAKKNLQLAEQDLRIEVEKAYHGILLAEDNLTNAKVQLERAKTQLKNATVSYEQGVVAKDSVFMAEAGYANAESNLFAAQKKVELAKMNLNKVMGRQLTAPLILTTKFEYKPKELGDVEAKVTSALKLRPEVIAVREMKEVTELNKDLALKYYASNTFVYKKAAVDARKAELGVREAEDSITLAVRAAYLNAAESIEKLKAAEKVKKMAEETYRITDLKYKSQMATMVEVLESMENLNQAELFYSSSVYDYNVAVAELENWAGKGLE